MMRVIHQPYLLALQAYEGDDNEVLLGLRVYTKSDARVNITGQLRHGKLISGKRQR
jgi:hypothetical protein